MNPEERSGAVGATPLQGDLATITATLRGQLDAVVLVGDADDRLAAYAATPQTSGAALTAILSGSTASLREQLRDQRLLRGGRDLRLATGRLDVTETLVLELTIAGAPIGTVWLVGAADAPAARRLLLDAEPDIAAALERLVSGPLEGDADLQFWWQVLHVEPGAPAAVTEAPPCQVLAWTAPGQRAITRLVAACRATSRGRYAGLAARTTGPVVYAISRPPITTQEARGIAREVAEAAGISDLRAGIGPAVGTNGQLPWGRACADDALALALRRGPWSVCAFDGEFADLVLEKVRGALGDLRLPTGNPLAALRDYDRRRATRLEETLQVWLACDSDTAAAATRLGVHPNTLRYRVSRAEGLLGLSTADRRARLALELMLDCPPASTLP
ncbi:MAG: PucR family transcriptional regulator [Mycobacteriales bacterium]